MNLPKVITLAWVVAGLIASVTACANAASIPPGQAQPAPSVSTPVPPQLNVPAGQQMVVTLHVQRGSQIYSCTAGAWTLKGPAALLTSDSQEVLHTLGPQWISVNDGSSVTGTPVATVPVQDAVAELLLKGSANQGDGLFAKVDFIQRLDTQGGLPPAGTCTDGSQTAVGYTAIYQFYAPAPPPQN
jgi:hypothetical protein